MPKFALQQLKEQRALLILHAKNLYLERRTPGQVASSILGMFAPGKQGERGKQGAKGETMEPPLIITASLARLFEREGNMTALLVKAGIPARAGTYLREPSSPRTVALGKLIEAIGLTGIPQFADILHGFREHRRFSDPYARIKFAEALGNLGNFRSYAILKSLASRDAEASVRVHALNAIADLKGTSPEDVKRILIERANPGKEFSQDVRHVAVRLLGRL